MAGKLGSSSFAVLLADGYDILAAKLQGFNWKFTALTERVDGLGDTWQSNSPTGVSRAEITQTGAFFDDTTNRIHDAFKASTDVVRILCWAPATNVIGKAFAAVRGAMGSTYAVIGQIGNLTKADVTYTVDGQLDRGVIVMNQAAQTTNWTGTTVDYTLDTSQKVMPITASTKAAACVITTPYAHGLTTNQVIFISGNSLSGPAINGQQTVTVLSTTTFSVAVNTSGSTGTGNDGSYVLASTVNGGVAYQQVSAYSGFTQVVGKVRHSTDDSTYVDLVTFTAVTAGPGDVNASQRSVVAAGTTVNRYLKHTGTVTGSGSITPFAGFVRS